MDPGPAQVLHADFLAQDRLDDLRAGDEHFGDLVDDEDEIGEGGGVDRASGAGAKDDRDLGDDPGGPRVAVEDLAVAGQRIDAFLDAGAAGVVDADERDAHLDGVIHDLGDLAGVHQPERSAGHGEILGEDGHGVAGHRARPGDDAVARQVLLLHVEVLAAVLDEEVVLVEGSGVEDLRDPVPGSQLAHGVLLGIGFGVGGAGDFIRAFEQVGYFCEEGHGTFLRNGLSPNIIKEIRARRKCPSKAVGG